MAEAMTPAERNLLIALAQAVSKSVGGEDAALRAALATFEEERRNQDQLQRYADKLSGKE